MKVGDFSVTREGPCRWVDYDRRFFFHPLVVGSASLATLYQSWPGASAFGEPGGLVVRTAPYRELRVDLISFRRGEQAVLLKPGAGRGWARFFMS